MKRMLRLRRCSGARRSRWHRRSVAVGQAARCCVAICTLLLTPFTLAAAGTVIPEYLPAPMVREAAGQRLLDITRAGERLLAVGARGLVILSGDEGQSWRQVPVPVSATLTAVSFADARHGWAVGHAGVIIATRDGGENWTLQFDGERANAQAVDYWTQRQSALEAALAESEAAGEQDEELSIALEDAGFALEDALINAETGPADPFLDVLFLDSREGFAVGAYGMLFHTVNGGEDWNIAIEGIDNPARFHYYALHRLGDRLFLSGEAGLLFVADRETLAWQRFEGVYDGSLFGIAELGGRVATFGLRGNLFLAEAQAEAETGDGGTDGDADTPRDGNGQQGLHWMPLPLEATPPGAEAPAPVTTTFYGGTTLDDGRLLLAGAGGAVLVVDAQGAARRYQLPSRSTLSAAYAEGDAVWLVGMQGVARLSEAKAQ